MDDTNKKEFEQHVNDFIVEMYKKQLEDQLNEIKGLRRLLNPTGIDIFSDDDKDINK